MSVSVCLCYAMLSCAVLSPASISCVYLLRLSRASISCVCLVRLSPASPPFLPYYPLTHFDPFDPFRISQAFDSYNYLSGSICSIGSISRAPHALQRVKSISLSLWESPTDSKGLTWFELFGVFGVYGVFEVFKGFEVFGVNCSYNTLDSLTLSKGSQLV